MDACTLGLVNCSAEPSALMSSTSSMPGMVFTPRRFRVPCRRGGQGRGGERLGAAGLCLKHTQQSMPARARAPACRSKACSGSGAVQHGPMLAGWLGLQYSGRAGLPR